MHWCLSADDIIYHDVCLCSSTFLKIQQEEATTILRILKTFEENI